MAIRWSLFRNPYRSLLVLLIRANYVSPGSREYSGRILTFGLVSLDLDIPPFEVSCFPFLHTQWQLLSRVSLPALQAVLGADYERFLVIAAYVSDRRKIRGPVMLCFLPLSIAGYAIIRSVHDNHVRYGALFLMAGGLYPSG